MKAKIFILAILFFLISMGGCDVPRSRPLKTFHSEDLFFTLSHIPKKVGFVTEVTSQLLETGLERLGFNLFKLPLGLTKDEMRRMNEEHGIEAVLSVDFFSRDSWAGRQYILVVRLIDFQQEKYLWEGRFCDSSGDRAMKQFLKYFEMDIKLINKKLEGSGVK